jgi:hypothetical protein
MSLQTVQVRSQEKNKVARPAVCQQVVVSQVATIGLTLPNWPNFSQILPRSLSYNRFKAEAWNEFRVHQVPGSKTPATLGSWYNRIGGPP